MKKFSMKKSHLLLFAIAATLSLVSFSVIRNPKSEIKWGFYAHKKINRQAVYSLPPEMMVFFKKNIGYLENHAVDPDMRRYAISQEAPRHFIDLDRYGKAPFDNLPRNRTDVLLRYAGYFFLNENNDTLGFFETDLKNLTPEDTLLVLNPTLTKGAVATVPLAKFRSFFIQNLLPEYGEYYWEMNLDSLAALLGTPKINCKKAFALDRFTEHGTLPYTLVWMQDRLTQAFLEKDPKKILKLSADLGHYIGDAHVPLHTTQNYNGQLTNQYGIHAFWESRLPELFADATYDFWVGKAVFFENPQDYYWNIVLTSHSLVDSVLLIEKAVADSMPSDLLMSFDYRGDKVVNTQSRDFSTAYHNRMGGMVENQMRGAISSVSSAWFTAWVNAGQPDLRDLAKRPKIEDDEEDRSLLEKLKLGKLFGREHE